MSEEALAQLQRQVQRERTARKEAERLLEEKSLALYRSNQQLRISALRSELLFESSRDALMTLAPPAWKFTAANQATLQLFGASSVAEFTTLGPWDVSPELQPDGRPSSEKAQEMIAAAMREGTHFFEWEHQRLDGQPFATDVLLTRMQLGDEVFLQATVRDINKRKQLEETLKASEARFKLIFNEAPLGIALIDSLTGHICSVNSMFAKIAGRTMEEMTHIDWMSITHPDDVQKDLDNMALLNAGKISGFQMEKRYLHHDGTVVWINMTVAPVYVEDKAHPRHLCMIEDITERKQMEDQVRQLAFYDPLTKLPNRRMLNDRLSQAMAASKRRGFHGALMFLDLDNFKPLNDTHGHVVGDLLLIEAANRLKNCVREMDTVARFGGDEFVVMLSELDADHAKSVSQASIVAEKIRATLSEPYLLIKPSEGADVTVEHHCTASVGVTLFSKHDASQDDILKQADAAMYQAKDAGRNLVRFYELKD